MTENFHQYVIGQHVTQHSSAWVAYPRNHWIKNITWDTSQANFHILTWMRRIGKKSVMLSCAQQHTDLKIMMLNCDELEREIAHHSTALCHYIANLDHDIEYVFCIAEIQELSHRADILRCISRHPWTKQVYITTTSIVAEQIKEHIWEQHVAIYHIWPMIYDEYKEITHWSQEEFLTRTWLPEAVSLLSKWYADMMPYYFQSLLHTIIVQDILWQSWVKDIKLLIWLFEQCIKLLGKPVTPNWLNTRLQQQWFACNHVTVWSYIEILAAWWLITLVPCRDNYEHQVTHKAIYPTDIWFINYFHPSQYNNNFLVRSALTARFKEQWLDFYTIHSAHHPVDFVIKHWDETIWILIDRNSIQEWYILEHWVTKIVKLFSQRPPIWETLLSLTSEYLTKKIFL